MNFDNPISVSIYVAFSVCTALFVAHYMTEVREPDQPTRWQHIKARYVVPPLLADDLADDLADEKPAISPAKRNDESGESSATMPKAERSGNFQFLDTFAALANLVSAGKLTETDALAFGVQVKAGGSPRYKAARAALTVALAATKPDKYPAMSAEQHAVRERLQLDD